MWLLMNCEIRWTILVCAFALLEFIFWQWNKVFIYFEKTRVLQAVLRFYSKAWNDK